MSQWQGPVSDYRNMWKWAAFQRSVRTYLGCVPGSWVFSKTLTSNVVCGREGSAFPKASCIQEASTSEREDPVGHGQALKQIDTALE